MAPSSDGIGCARDAGVNAVCVNRAIEVKNAITAKVPIRPIATAGQQQVLADATHRQLLLQFLQVQDWKDRTTGQVNRDALATFKNTLTKPN